MDELEKEVSEEDQRESCNIANELLPMMMMMVLEGYENEFFQRGWVLLLF